MTEVAFHFNVPERLAYTCRLLRKICSQNRSAVVVASAEELSVLDKLLWQVSAHDFLGHVLHQPDTGEASVNATQHMLAQVARIELAPDVAASQGHDVLVSLQAAVPEGFERFQRLVEVVSLEEADRQAARTRWRHYSSRGYHISRHDVRQGRIV